MALSWAKGRRSCRLCPAAILIGYVLQGPLCAKVHAQTPPVEKSPPPTPNRAAADKTAANRAAQSPEQKLERAKLAYQRGDYGAIVLLLRPLLYPQTLLAQEEQVLAAHKLLALSYYFEHDEAGAEQEFNLLLSLRPDFALDPVVDPLQAVAFLDDIRRRNAERLEEIRRRQAEEEQRHRVEQEQLQKQAEALAQKRTRRVYIERVIYKRFSIVDFVPFGVPQLIARRRAVGASLLVGEVLSGAASLGTWIAVRVRYPNGVFPAREYIPAQALTGTYLGTGALFWGLVITGLIDALVHAKTITEVREISAPPSDLPPRETPPLRAAVAPFFLPEGGLGVSIGGIF